MTPSAPDAVEPGRLRRAAQLAVKRLGPGQFLVQGQTEPAYTVDLTGDQMCFCRDQEYRGGRIAYCKHILASRLASGDMGLIHTLAALYEPQLRAEREMGLTDDTDGDDEAE